MVGSPVYISRPDEEQSSELSPTHATNVYGRNTNNIVGEAVSPLSTSVISASMQSPDSVQALVSEARKNADQVPTCNMI